MNASESFFFPDDKPADRNAASPRISLDPETVKNGLGQLVLTLVELVRQLLEKQAIRRIEGG